MERVGYLVEQVWQAGRHGLPQCQCRMERSKIPSSQRFVQQDATSMSIINVQDINGRCHMVNTDAITRVSEAGASSQWHGVKTIIRLIDGSVIEARSTMNDLS